MMINEKEALTLLSKYNSGTATDTEIKLLESWYSAEILKQSLSETEEDFSHLKDEIWAGTLQRANLTEEEEHISEKRPVRSIKRWYQLTAAAVILIIGSVYLLNKQQTGENSLSKTLEIADHITAGKNKATLTLANGHQIILSDDVKGKLAEEAGVSITKTSSGELIYTVISKPDNATPSGSVYNTISTAAGENYQVVLPDGSKIKLNAASSLKYPASFAFQKDRRVELIGEAYFEVAKDKNHPFKVKTNAQEVEVLGTHFNISSYADHAITNTTLIEGSVKVSSLSYTEGKERAAHTILLKPGEQALQKANNITMVPADIEQATAWTEGWFYFKSTNLQDVLSEAAKWYDLEIVYRGAIPTDRFTGKIPKTASLGKFIKLLQLSDIKFSIEGRKMIIN
ncbi:ferric-dicitrate binding protein FerR (iron transport regulator) [Pedobacter cryoconitis]|uniref:Ferric-dicitrate binding protein FerR (Iron transport regulator) n=1 Tax=Pedobacter cryoconitis TaxID=188932 RepID=A0A7W8YP21_9SPHI|nr:FecR family protein [Pedobacter cryoconitis]MBB5619054.1 ferric-dicitrate binding protein FerR (iron transport regulator) [Pedobacter cryoconitis]MBB5644351.1 ferric-dicitrate binding protein FerR (iron transport regulator) [Pedobacter cryoconitis]